MVTLNFKLSNLNKRTNRFYANFETYFAIYKKYNYNNNIVNFLKLHQSLWLSLVF